MAYKFLRYSRPVGSKSDFQHKTDARVAVKQVFIGARNPGAWRATEVSHEFVPVAPVIRRRKR